MRLKVINDTLQCQEREKNTTVDEALSMTGFGMFNVYLFFFCTTILLGMIMDTLGFSYIIPASQCDLQLTTTQKGWLAAIPFACIVLTMYTWGYLADMYGRKKTLVYSMSIGSCLSILSSFSPNLTTFAIMRFLSSIFTAAPSALCYAYIGELSPTKYRDTIMVLTNSSVTLSIGIVPMFAWIILPTNFKFDIKFLPNGYRPWRLLVALFALPYFVCSILFLYFPESPKFLISKGKGESALNILRKIYSINSKKPPEDFAVNNIEIQSLVEENTKKTLIVEVWDQIKPLFKTPHLKYTMMLSFIQFVVFSTSNGFYIWFPTLLDQVLNNFHLVVNSTMNLCDAITYSNATILHPNNDNMTSITCNDTLNTGTFSLTILLAIVISAINFVTAFLLRIVSKRIILVLLFSIVSVILFIIHWITYDIIYLILFAAIQLISICIGIVNSFTVDIFPTNVRGMAVCLTLLFGRCGSIYGTNIIGILTEVMCPASFFSFSLLTFLSVIVCFYLPSNNKKRNK